MRMPYSFTQKLNENLGFCFFKRINTKNYEIKNYFWDIFYNLWFMIKDTAI